MKLKDLKELVLSCHDSIYGAGCYSVKDIIRLDNGVAELERRGYEVEEEKTLTIYKGE